MGLRVPVDLRRPFAAGDRRPAPSSRRRINRPRLVYRDELGYYFGQIAQGWRPVLPPSVSRGPSL